MWDFIWHLRGVVPVSESVPVETLLDRIEQMLGKQRKPVTQRDHSGLAFNSPLWEDLIGPNWLAMVIYDRGNFLVEENANGHRVKYDLRSLHGLVFCMFGAAMFFVFGAANESFLGGIKYATFALGWLYGMNMLLAWSRIPRLIRRAVDGR